ncbi:uncharacterized protein AC631_02046 [Debaryomyces fabryi]|uniref:Uncharacterized protein n=1 Tax=Debaryomyces fabryi TaxID=58627 RepID=A0A0V1Q147_9ASCO|nr:uncharacterized protein AC631_02046 [Debaryomyces fabryi]KSA02228.1 hypothetical protein AC631_02046 [Debaryomyces fabryi]CUM46594.1 unnamed protein product [Debaryomyces fabryi]
MLSILRNTRLQSHSPRCWKLVVPLITFKRCISDRNSSLDQDKIVDLLLKSSKIEPTQKSNTIINDFNKNFVIHDTVELPGIAKPKIPFPSIKYGDYDTADMENLGQLYIKYITVKYIINTRPHIRFTEAFNYADNLLECAAMAFDSRKSSFLEYIGQFCIADISQCNQYIEGFFVEDAKSSQLVDSFVSYFLKIAPRFKSDLVDYTLIWDSVVPNSTIEIPKLEYAKDVFNPLFLVDSSNATKFMSCSIFDETLNSALIGDKLQDLQNYGKLMFEFYTVKHLFYKLDISNPLFINIIKNLDSLFDNIISFSALTDVINCPQYFSIKRDIRTKSNSNEIFYQYLGVLDLNNNIIENLVEKWVGRLVDYLIANSNGNEIDPTIKFKKNPVLLPQYKKQKNLPVVPCLTMSESMSGKVFPHGYADTIMLDELGKLGQSCISLAFKNYLVTNGLGDTENENLKHEKEFVDIVSNHINESIKVKNITPNEFSNSAAPFTSNQFLGLYLIEKFEDCMSFLNQFFVGGYSPSKFESSTSYLKYLAYQTNMPSFRIRPNIGLKDSSPLRLPPLNDTSRTTRLLLLNNSVIKPSFGTYKSRNWKRNNSLKNCLHLWHNWGSLLYKVSIHHALLSKLSQVSSPYIQELFKLLTSNNFCKYLLDDSGNFELIENTDYQALLMEKRYTNSLINAQLCQYLATVHMYDPNVIKEWSLSFVELFINLIENLNSEEVLHLINTFTEKFKMHKFSLCQTFADNIIGKIKEERVVIDIPYINEPSKYSIASLEEIGKSFLSYSIASFNIHYGLDSFINSKIDTMDMMKEVAETKSIKALLYGKSIYQYIGLLVDQKGNTEAQRVIYNFLEQILNTKAKPLNLSKIPTLKLKINEKVNGGSDFSVWKNAIQFPKIHNDALHKLLLVNFYVSRTFFQLTRSHGGNIHELPDLCTKFNTVGGEFYKFLVVKHAYNQQSSKALLLPEVILEKSIKLLTDRIFMSIVCYKSGILYDPFNNAEYLKLTKKVMKNNFFFLRFSSQSFRQYMGSLCYHDIDSADDWVGNIVNTLLDELCDASTLERQHQLLNELESEMQKYYLQKRI